MFKYISFIIIFLFMLSCGKENKLEINVSDIEIKTTIKRFDQEFYTGSSSNLTELKNKYPYLFPEQNHDSIWIQKMQDKDEQELFAETQTVFSNFDEEKEKLTDLFKHIKYYYPDFKAPTIITLLTNVDYEIKLFTQIAYCLFH
ncbi:MAG: hypothetical protein KJO83_08010 [Bacteroidia bacterium]|nr:hypothetical protein [Bacteroidia bacterium]